MQPKTLAEEIAEKLPRLDISELEAIKQICFNLSYNMQKNVTESLLKSMKGE